MLKNITKKLNAITLLLIFVLFLFITLIGDNLFSYKKVYADNPSPTFTPTQVSEIQKNPTHYISFTWQDSETVLLDFNIPGYSGTNNLVLFDTDGAVNFLAKQTKLYSNNFCGGNSTGINISSYYYYSNRNKNSGRVYGEDQPFKIWYNQANTVGGACQSINIKPKSGSRLNFNVSHPSFAGLFMKYNSNAISMLDNGGQYSTFSLQKSNIPKIYLFLDTPPTTQQCSDRIVVNDTTGTPTAELYEYANSPSGNNAYQPPSTTGQSSNAQAGSSCKIDSASSLSQQFDPNNDFPRSAGTLSGGSSSISLPYSPNGLGYNFTDFIKNLPQLIQDQPNSTSLSGTSSGSSSSSSNNNTPTPTCQSSSWSLSWLACSVINEIAKIERSVENVINALLFVKTFNYSSTACSSFSKNTRSQLQTKQAKNQTTPGASSCIYEVWNNFRTYADVLLVIGFLVVIFAESIGGGLIDAYSIRKILPRILIAAILINLSIYIVGALVDITNIFGQGIYSLLTVPFRNSLSIHLSSTTGTTLGLGFAGVVLAVGTASIFAMASRGGSGKSMLDIIIGLLFMIGLPVLMAVLGILVTIIFRIAIIYFLTIISPIAFVLYILPNTEQYFKKWWKVLMEALLVYPIVFIVFAMSKITGAIVSSIGLPDGLGVLAQILGIAASLAPLFLIPFAFKIAGNTIGTVHDAVTKGRQRLHGGIKGNAQDPNSLQNKIKRRFGMATNNMGISKGALFDQVGNAPRLLTRKGREERRRRLSERSTMRGSVLGSEFLDKDGIWQKNKNNDKFLLAHADKDLAIRRRNEAEKKGDFQTVAAWDQAISVSDMVTRNNATMALSANQLASTGFGFSAGRKGYNELATMTARHAGVSFNDLEKDSEGNVIGVKEGAANAGIYQKMMNDNQFALRQAQRYDLGGVNDGKGYDYDAGMDKASGYTAGNAKPQTWEAGAQEKLGIEKLSGNAGEDAKMLNTNWTEGKISVPEIDAYMYKLTESYQGATGGNKKIIMDQMNAIEEFAKNPDPNFKYLGATTLDYEKIKNLKNSAILGRGIDPNILNSKQP
jgi:hypothetical protein